MLTSSSNDLAGKVIVLLRTSSVARIPVYHHLRDACGLTLVMVHPFVNPTFDGCFDHWIVSDTNDVAVCEAAIDREMAALGLVPDAILSFDEYAVFPAACIATRKGFQATPLPPPALQGTSVKSDFRDFCARHNINSPKSVALRSPIMTTEQLAAALSPLSFPVVIKPSPGAGSLLAKLCTSLADLQSHATTMWHVLGSHPDVKHFLALGTPVHLLVEEYIGGQEVDIDCVIERGRVVFCSISDNNEVQPPFFVETGGVCPSRLGAHEQRALRELLDAFVVAHGTSLHGVLHFEAKFDFARDSAFVIEVNCRLGSAETNTMITTVYNGLQLGECLVRCGLQLPLSNLTPEVLAAVGAPPCHAASVNIYPAMEGVLTHVRAPLEDKSMVGCSVSHKPGTMVAPPPKSFFLLSWMVARGASADEAVTAIQRMTAAFEQEIQTAQ